MLVCGPWEESFFCLVENVLAQTTPDFAYLVRHRCGVGEVYLTSEQRPVIGTKRFNGFAQPKAVLPQPVLCLDDGEPGKSFQSPHHLKKNVGPLLFQHGTAIPNTPPAKPQESLLLAHDLAWEEYVTGPARKELFNAVKVPDKLLGPDSFEESSQESLSTQA
jgi:hypothetical protein